MCVELIKQQMTIVEAENNLGELISVSGMSQLEKKHMKQLKVALDELDIVQLEKLLMEGSDE